MAGDYTARHARALRLVEKRGAPVSFVRRTSTVDPATDQPSAPVTVTVEGQAVEVKGDPEEYEALNLIERSPITLMFVPTVQGEVPAKLSTVEWAGAKRTVQEVRPIRPAGVAIAARVLAT